jgi:glycosyltransferase involved in cell wall biosynthesis
MNAGTSVELDPVRVLMITPDHLMIDRRILQEAQTLRGAGYEVEILAGFECPQPSAYVQDGVRIRRFKFDWADSRVDWILPRLHWVPDRMRRLLLRIAGRGVSLITGRSIFENYVLWQVMASSYDILHCHDFPLLAVAVEAKRRRPAPLVYDAHELYHAQAQLPVGTRRRYRRRERRLIRHADLVISVNPFIARSMADDYGCALPEVLLNAAPQGARVDARAGLRELLHLEPRDRIVLYQGWMSPERGIDRLVRAARYFPAHVRLVLIGYGGYEQVLRELSSEQGTDDGRVIFFGRVASEDLAPLTRSADLGVIPYHAIDLNNYYSSPNKLFEYAAAGLPFVSNDLPFLRSIIDRYGFGIAADLGRPEAVAAAILSVVEDPIKLRGLKELADQAGRELNWEKEGVKLLALYERVILPKVVRDAVRTAGDAVASSNAGHEPSGGGLAQ